MTEWPSDFLQRALTAAMVGQSPQMPSLAFHRARDAAAALLNQAKLARALPSDAFLIADVVTPEIWVFTYCAGSVGLRVVRHKSSTAVRHLDRERQRA